MVYKEYFFNDAIFDKQNTDYRGVNEFVWEAYARIYGGGPIVVRDDIDIYGSAVNARLTDPNIDQTYYRCFEKTHKDLIDELLKVKKLEKEEKKEKEIEESYKKIRQIGRKESKFESKPLAQPNGEPKNDIAEKSEKSVISNIIAFFK